MNNSELSTVMPLPSLAPQPMEAAELIVLYLEQLDIDYVFGIPGGAIEPIYNALAKSARREGGIKPVQACHESAAAYMADGYHRESGKLGVCIATSGPGATNLITGVACAYDNNIPMLVITGQPAIPSFGKNALQESACTGVNVVGMFRHCTRYNSLISHEDQLETKLIHAIISAFQAPQGPVHLSIPVDILRAKVSCNNLGDRVKRQLNIQNTTCDMFSVQELEQEFIQSAQRNEQPLFFIGRGAASAIDSILALVELTGAKFITTPDAKGLINCRHHAYRGVFGLGGHVSATLTLQHHTKNIIAIGTDFSEFTSAGWSAALMNDHLIHVDSNCDNMRQTPMAKLHVLGNVKYICEKVVERLVTEGFKPKTEMRKCFSGANPNIIVEDYNKYQSNESPIKPQRLMRELSERFPAHTRYVADAGNSMMWAPHYLQKKCARTENARLKHSRAPLKGVYEDLRSPSANWLRVTMNFAPMGWAIGASVGIAAANPNNPVVCITGDGSYLMSGQEITVAARLKLPVIFVILNDSVYGMVMHGQRLAKAEPVAYELPKVNYALIANAMGINSYIVNSVEDFQALDIAAITKRQGPTLLDVRVDKEEVPPMVMRLKTLGTVDEGAAL